MRPLVALALLGVAPAHAFQLWGTGPLAGASVQITTDLEMRYHQTMLDDPGSRIADGPFELFPAMAVHDYFEQVGRTNLQVTKDTLSIGLQLDEVALFSNRYVLDGEELQTVPLYGPGINSPAENGFFLLEKMFVKKCFNFV